MPDRAAEPLLSEKGQYFLLVHPDLLADTEPAEIVQWAMEQPDWPRGMSRAEVKEVRASKCLPPGASSYLMRDMSFEFMRHPLRLPRPPIDPRDWRFVR